MPRRQLHSVPYALSARDLECTGCVSAQELAFKVYNQDEVNDLVEGIIGELRGIESPFVDGRTLSDLMQNLSPLEPALGKG